MQRLIIFFSVILWGIPLYYIYANVKCVLNNLHCDTTRFTICIHSLANYEILSRMVHNAIEYDSMCVCAFEQSVEI